jgi:serine/threonine protein kinase
LYDQSIKTNYFFQVDKSYQTRRTRFDSLISWQIPHNRIQVMENNKIGQGSFGSVYKATDANHGLVAVKYLSSKTNKDLFYEFKNEVTILQSTEHQNILTFIGCLLNNRLAIVTEWCPGSSLYNHIHNYPDYDLWTQCEIVDIAKQIATGMEYLHMRNIIHCDLKSNNIFLVPLSASNNSANSNNDSQNEMTTSMERINNNTSGALAKLLKWKVKIGDFGVAKVKSVYEQEQTKNLKLDGSILWMVGFDFEHHLLVYTYFRKFSSHRKL